MSFWPDKTPKSTGNAFDLSIAKPSGLDTPHERMKAARHASTAITAFATKSMPGLSQAAQTALRVPAKRQGITLPGSACLSRIPEIPKAQRSAKK
jgi:hypothetical protein